jgi:hypothetical protein
MITRSLAQQTVLSLPYTRIITRDGKWFDNHQASNQSIRYQMIRILLNPPIQHPDDQNQKKKEQQLD